MRSWSLWTAVPARSVMARCLSTGVGDRNCRSSSTLIIASPPRDAPMSRHEGTRVAIFERELILEVVLLFQARRLGLQLSSALRSLRSSGVPALAHDNGQGA